MEKGSGWLIHSKPVYLNLVILISNAVSFLTGWAFHLFIDQLLHVVPLLAEVYSSWPPSLALL